MADLDDWARSVAGELGVDPPSEADLALVLDVAREVAHQVLRTGAPVTAFLLGVAVGRGAELGAAAEMVIELTGRSP